MNMNTLGIYSIRDTVAGQYNQPFFYAGPRADDLAKRSFATLRNDPASFICKNPNDYRLYKIGEMDMESGAIVGFEPKELFVTEVK